MKMKGGASQVIMINKQAFMDMEKLREEFDSLMETIEIMNDRELIEGIKRSVNDIKSGRATKLKSVDELDKIWQD